jgi:hypothetical protein
MKSCGKEEHKCKANGNGGRNCDRPAEFEKEHGKTNKKESEAENENNRKRSKYARDIRFLEAERVHVAEAEGFRSIAQTAHVSSYPLEGDDPYERSRETEHQAEEPENIHADTDGAVDSRLIPCDPVLARRLGGNLPQELNTFLSGIRSESLL